MRKTWSTPALEEARKALPCPICTNSLFVPALKCEGFSYVRCKTCNLVQINPQPLPEEVFLRYQSQESQGYLAYELANEENFLGLQKKALADIGFNSLSKGLTQRRFLDVGCATGALLANLKSDGWQVTGIELGKEMADYARQRRALNVLNSRLEEADFLPASFDVVHASHVIEHVNAPADFLRAVHRSLHPGVYFIVITPNIGGLQARLFGSAWRSAIFDHLYLFSKRSLRKLLEKNGFKICKIRSWGGIGRGFAPSWVKKPLDKLAKLWGFGDVMIFLAKKT